MAALAFEAHHHIDHVFQHARPGDGAVLGDMADQDQRGAVLLGVADQFERAAAHLADRAGRAFDRVGMHGLDRIDHQQCGRLHAAERGQDVAHRGRRGELDRRIGQPQARRAQPHLAGRFLAADIDRALARRARRWPRPAAAASTCRCPDRRPSGLPSRAPARRPARGRIRRARSAAAPEAAFGRRARRMRPAGRRPTDRASAENTVAGASSTSVFHSAQSAHCPCQRCEDAAASLADVSAFWFGHGLAYREQMGNAIGENCAFHVQFAWHSRPSAATVTTMRQKELRIALVCYGGVSLAVYMHGVTKEIWHLARASRDVPCDEPLASMGCSGSIASCWTPSAEHGETAAARPARHPDGSERRRHQCRVPGPGDLLRAGRSIR